MKDTRQEVVVARDPSTFVISLTPFDRDEGLDEEGLRRHLRRLGAAGIGVYVGGAGSGEGYTLTENEVRRVLDIAVEELKGVVPVRAMGVEPRTHREMLRFVEVVEASGIDAMQVYSLDVGHLGRPNPDEIERYLNDVLSVSRVPSVLSTHYSVGYVIPTDVLVRTVEKHPHVIGVNCSTLDVNYLVSVADALPERIELHAGVMSQAFVALSVGASGFLSSEGNIVPEWCVDVIEAYKKGDLVEMSTVFGRLVRFANRLFATGGGIATTKSALELLGYAGGMPRRPRLAVESEAERARIAAVLEEFGLTPQVARAG
jgi:4-hydroxy-tetrahydrodipicolinate synthase